MLGRIERRDPRGGLPGITKSFGASSGGMLTILPETDHECGLL
jgi:hypothetical protein